MDISHEKRETKSNIKSETNHKAAELKVEHLLKLDPIRPVADLTNIEDFTRSEHDLKFSDAIRQYPTAACWSMFICIAIIMAGFDAQIVTSFYALPAFQKKVRHSYVQR